MKGLINPLNTDMYSAYIVETNIGFDDNVVKKLRLRWLQKINNFYDLHEKAKLERKETGIPQFYIIQYRKIQIHHNGRYCHLFSSNSSQVQS